MEQLHTQAALTDFFHTQISAQVRNAAQARELAKINIIQARHKLQPLTAALQTCFAERSILYDNPAYVAAPNEPGTLHYYEHDDIQEGLEFVTGLELNGHLIVKITIDADNITLKRGIKTTIIPHPHLTTDTISEFARKIAAYIIPQLSTEVQPCKAQ